MACVLTRTAWWLSQGEPSSSGDNLQLQTGGWVSQAVASSDSNQVLHKFGYCTRQNCSVLDPWWVWLSDFQDSLSSEVPLMLLHSITSEATAGRRLLSSSPVLRWVIVCAADVHQGVLALSEVCVAEAVDIQSMLQPVMDPPADCFACIQEAASAPSKQAILCVFTALSCVTDHGSVPQVVLEEGLLSSIELVQIRLESQPLDSSLLSLSLEAVRAIVATATSAVTLPCAMETVQMAAGQLAMAAKGDSDFLTATVEAMLQLLSAIQTKYATLESTSNITDSTGRDDTGAQTFANYSAAAFDAIAAAATETWFPGQDPLMLGNDQLRLRLDSVDTSTPANLTFSLGELSKTNSSQTKRRLLLGEGQPLPEVSLPEPIARACNRNPEICPMPIRLELSYTEDVSFLLHSVGEDAFTSAVAEFWPGVVPNGLHAVLVSGQIGVWLPDVIDESRIIGEAWTTIQFPLDTFIEHSDLPFGKLCARVDQETLRPQIIEEAEILDGNRAVCQVQSSGAYVVVQLSYRIRRITHPYTQMRPFSAVYQAGQYTPTGYSPPLYSTVMFVVSFVGAGFVCRMAWVAYFDSHRIAALKQLKAKWPTHVMRMASRPLTTLRSLGTFYDRGPGSSSVWSSRGGRAVSSWFSRASGSVLPHRSRSARNPQSHIAISVSGEVDPTSSRRQSGMSIKRLSVRFASSFLKYFGSSRRQSRKPLEKEDSEGFNARMMERMMAMDAASECDDDGNTALHLVIRKGNLAAVKALLEQSCHGPRNIVEAQNSDGDTALHLAAEFGHAEILNEMVEAIVSEASVPAGSNMPDGSVIRQGWDSFSMNMTNDAGDTALHVAAANGHEEVIEALQSLSGLALNINGQNNQGWTPLHLAVQGGHLAAVLRLLHSSPSIDVVDEHTGNNPAAKPVPTPLHLAAVRGQVKIVQHLLDYMAETPSETIDSDLKNYMQSRTYRTSLEDSDEEGYGNELMELVRTKSRYAISQRYDSVDLSDDEHHDYEDYASSDDGLLEVAQHPQQLNMLTPDSNATQEEQ